MSKWQPSGHFCRFSPSPYFGSLKDFLTLLFYSAGSRKWCRHRRKKGVVALARYFGGSECLAINILLSSLVYNVYVAFSLVMMIIFFGRIHHPLGEMSENAFLQLFCQAIFAIPPLFLLFHFRSVKRSFFCQTQDDDDGYFCVGTRKKQFLEWGNITMLAQEGKIFVL